MDSLIVGNHWIINLFHFYFYFYFLFPPKIFYPSTAFEFLTLQYHYIFFDICLWVLYHKISGFFLLFPTSYCLPPFRFLILWENIEQPISILFLRKITYYFYIEGYCDEAHMLDLGTWTKTCGFEWCWKMWGEFACLWGYEVCEMWFAWLWEKLSYFLHEGVIDNLVGQIADFIILHPYY